jgi:hypothetical protein
MDEMASEYEDFLRLAAYPEEKEKRAWEAAESERAYEADRRASAAEQLEEDAYAESGRASEAKGGCGPQSSWRRTFPMPRRYSGSSGTP